MKSRTERLDAIAHQLAHMLTRVDGILQSERAEFSKQVKALTDELNQALDEQLGMSPPSPPSFNL